MSRYSKKNLGNFVNPNFYYTWLLTIGITEDKAYEKQRFIPDYF